MKKAVINQMFLGFVILGSLVMFVATISDEKLAKGKSYDLQDIITQSTKALSNTYFVNMNGDLIGEELTTVPLAMCQAEKITNQLLQATPLGQELFDSGSVEYVWKDAGVYDPNDGTYKGIPDGRPDSITVKVSEQTVDNFWYKFLDKDTFSIPEIARAVDVNKFSYNVDVTFRGVIEAGYYNMVGIYEEDEHGCPHNAKFILADKNAWASKIGDKLETIQMPQTKMFFIADGYRRFGDFANSNGSGGVGRNNTISLDTPISFDCSSDYPTAIVSPSSGPQQRSDDSHHNLTSRANVYFQDTALNFDKETIGGNEVETDHMNEIAEKDWGAFVAVMEKKSKWNQEAHDYANTLSSSEKNYLANLAADYDQWLTYAAGKGIDFSYDPNGEYVFVSEDLAATTDPSDSDLRHDKWRSDKDFSDMSFSMKKIFVPEPVGLHLISSDSVMNVDCSIYN